MAGAPRESWAGVSHQFMRPEIGSGDGALLIMMKQTRAVFLDRMYRAVADLSVCEHPPLMYDALERNAYLLSSKMFSCAMVFPGILVPPFADERYDDASMYSRPGWIPPHARNTRYGRGGDEDHAASPRSRAIATDRAATPAPPGLDVALIPVVPGVRGCRCGATTHCEAHAGMQGSLARERRPSMWNPRVRVWRI